ncbi:hypothetical protein KFE25_007241 [Diacronema lutheri]|uniref:Cilia- and flagella-associated protein 300 n=1 Tax=Diacronema lutheri TaxID=2081491 RepID=A0A7R9UUV1_DIALT|nr:hypothetical protein KFE25_007241 [Diacronema lutheri]|mmetsp:Transcript_4830/g.14964  ORF Transcript_4830/g.14964 Transcript_4830/m.14964 type:complete len:261 (+) Transcript_4830:28-810(+)
MAHREPFAFHPVDGVAYGLRAPGERAERLKKWDLIDSMVLATFRYDRQLGRADVEHFVTDFFNDARVRAALPVCTGRGRWGTLPAPVTAVRMAQVPATRVRMDLFDRLFEAGVARRETGDVAKCFDTPLADGVLASDRLRLALLDEGSDEYALFSVAERDELLFRILRHLAVGGGLCQYDDSINAVLDSVKSAYRDLVRVHKSAQGQLEVSSWTYRVDALEAAAGGDLWPRASPHNFAYVSVDHARRHVTFWSNAFLPLL